MPYWEFVDFGVRTVISVGLPRSNRRKPFTMLVSTLRRLGIVTPPVFAVIMLPVMIATLLLPDIILLVVIAAVVMSPKWAVSEFTHDSVVNEYQASEWQRLNRSRTDVKAVRNIGRGGNLIPDYSLKPFMWRVSYQDQFLKVCHQIRIRVL